MTAIGGQRQRSLYALNGIYGTTRKRLAPYTYDRPVVWFASEVVHYVKNNIIYTHKTLDTHGLCVEEYARKLYSWGYTPAHVDCAPMLQYYANSCVYVCVERWDEAYDHEGGADFDVFDDDEDVDDDYIEWKLFKS